MLRLEGLRKRFGAKMVVDGVSLSVKEGEVVGLLGKNGAGKTTTFRMAVGLLTPDKGKVELFGKDVTRWAMFRRCRLGLGYLPQEHSVFAGLTVWDNIEAVLRLRGVGKEERHRRTQRLLEEFGIAELSNRKAGALSGGEKRRLEIARALATQPRILLLDEPFTGVDPIAIQEIKRLVVGLVRRNIGVLVTDHNVRDTLTVVDRAYILDEGRILASGKPQDLVGDPVVRRAYLGEAFEASFDEEMERWRKIKEVSGRQH